MNLTSVLVKKVGEIEALPDNESNKTSNTAKTFDVKDTSQFNASVVSKTDQAFFNPSRVKDAGMEFDVGQNRMLEKKRNLRIL